LHDHNREQNKARRGRTTERKDDKEMKGKNKMTKAEAEELKENHETLVTYEGSKVRVTCNVHGCLPNHFELGMMIAGDLERLPESDTFRIVVADETYVYFEAADIALINWMSSVPTVVIKEIVTKSE